VNIPIEISKKCNTLEKIIMDETLFWFVAAERCPFDNSELGKHKQIFKSNSGDLSLRIWFCPLCERHYIEYDNNHNVLRRFPWIKCQFLYFDSPVVNARRNEENRLAGYQNTQEPIMVPEIQTMDMKKIVNMV
jgi:hypothetical protein